LGGGDEAGAACPSPADTGARRPHQGLPAGAVALPALGGGGHRGDRSWHRSRKSPRLARPTHHGGGGGVAPVATRCPAGYSRRDVVTMPHRRSGTRSNDVGARSGERRCPAGGCDGRDRDGHRRVPSRTESTEAKVEVRPARSTG